MNFRIFLHETISNKTFFIYLKYIKIWLESI
jgi:hypothetical protein